jgi:sugar lactone lactonase YvrE
MPAGGMAAEPDPYLEKLETRTATAILGELGSGPGQLNYPRGIAVDEAGNLFVADSENHRVVRFSPSGESFSWGDLCDLAGEIIPAGCTDPDGDGPLPAGPGMFNSPWDIATDTRGRVYVADTWNHRIQVFDGDGTFLGQWGDATLVDADASPGGRQGSRYGFYGPRGIAVSSGGIAYVADTGNERILAYQIVEDESGNIRAEYLFQWGTMGPAPGEFLEPVGIAVDAAGRVYVADTWNQRIQVFAPDLDGSISPEPVVTWDVTGWESTSLDNKPYLAVGPGTQVYFAVPERHYVAATDTGGNVLTVWGQYGTDWTSFQLPTGVAVDAQGQVYVSDAGNGRVLIFTVP